MRHQSEVWKHLERLREKELARIDLLPVSPPTALDNFTELFLTEANIARREIEWREIKSPLPSGEQRLSPLKLDVWLESLTKLTEEYAPKLKDIVGFHPELVGAGTDPPRWIRSQMEKLLEEILGYELSGAKSRDWQPRTVRPIRGDFVCVCQDVGDGEPHLEHPRFSDWSFELWAIEDKPWDIRQVDRLDSDQIKERVLIAKRRFARSLSFTLDLIEQKTRVAMPGLGVTSPDNAEAGNPFIDPTIYGPPQSPKKPGQPQPSKQVYAHFLAETMNSRRAVPNLDDLARRSGMLPNEGVAPRVGFIGNDLTIDAHGCNTATSMAFASAGFEKDIFAARQICIEHPEARDPSVIEGKYLGSFAFMGRPWIQRNIIDRRDATDQRQMVHEIDDTLRSYPTIKQALRQYPLPDHDTRPTAVKNGELVNRYYEQLRKMRQASRPTALGENELRSRFSDFEIWKAIDKMSATKRTELFSVGGASSIGSANAEQLFDCIGSIFSRSGTTVQGWWKKYRSDSRKKRPRRKSADHS
jgi:hypothetical protein